MWVEVLDQSLTVGWRDYAEYRLQIEDRTGYVDVALGPITEQEAARAFVLSFIPLTLPFFGLEPIHASAVLAREGALLLMGDSGSGKSTTAATLVQRGLPFLTDDASAIDGDGQLWPGPPLAAARPGPESDSAPAVYDGKEVRYIEGHMETPFDVAASLVLKPSQGAALEVIELESARRIQLSLAHARSPWLMMERRRAGQFVAVSKIASKPVGLLTFDHTRHDPRSVCDVIQRWLEPR